jgi:hypothetical protein
VGTTMAVRAYRSDVSWLIDTIIGEPENVMDL